MMERREPPRRADVKTGPYPDMRWVDIFLDGERVQGIVMADMDAGTLVRFARDAGGMIIHDQGRVMHEVLHGHVEIRWRKDVPESVFVSTPILAS